MSRCGTVRSLPVAAASPGLRDSGIGAPLQSEPSCVPGRARGNSAPFSPLGYLGVTLSSGTFWPLHPTGGQRDGNAVWTPHGREKRGIGSPRGMQRDGGPAGGHPTVGTRGGAQAGGEWTEGWAPHRGMRNILGMWMHMRVSSSGNGRRHSWVTPQREDGDIALGISGV